MVELTIIVPSRGRPGSVADMVNEFEATCALDTGIVLSIDSDDPFHLEYMELLSLPRVTRVVQQGEGTMVTALNLAAQTVDSRFVGFQGDDHRPRTQGWDAAYVDALREMGTGIVYGDDLLQRDRLPTQCAMTSDIVDALGYMAPPVLQHMYVDNAWLTLGRRADCIRYLPDVVVEHLHPVNGKALWDEGYARVNHPSVFDMDLRAFSMYCIEQMPLDVEKIQALKAVHHA